MRRRISRFALLVAIAAACAAHTAPAASAAPQWLLDANANTNAAPGGQIDYHLQILNVGDAAAADPGGDPVVLQVALPAGVSAERLEFRIPGFGTFDWTDPFFGWGCSGDGPDAPGILGAQNLSCTIPQPFDPHSLTFTAKPIVVAEVAGGASGTREATFTLSGGGTTPASTFELTRITAAEPPFGVEMFDGGAIADAAGAASTQAGDHPYAASTTIEFNSHTDPNPLIGDRWPVAAPKNLEVDLPPGLVGFPLAAERCGSGDLTQNDCRPEAQVGTVVIRLNPVAIGSNVVGPLPVYNLEPPPDVPALFGFNYVGVVTTFDAQVRSESDYGITIRARNLPEGLAYTGNTVTFWGTPADEAHLPERACLGSSVEYSSGGAGCPSAAPPLPFLRNPTSCSPAGEGLPWRLRVASWKEPGQLVSAGFASHQPPGYPRAPELWGPEVGTTGCAAVPFTPSLSALPTTDRADSPSGLEVEIAIPQTCAQDAAEICQSDLKDAAVTLPAGMSLNPAAAAGLGSCSPEQVGLATPVGSSPIHFTKAPARCPDDAKIGEVAIETPLLAKPLQGSVYLARQSENPFGSLLAIYLVAEGSGVVVKQAGEIRLGEGGQLTTVFREAPQTPFSKLRVSLFGGPRAALRTPPGCGTYATRATLTPWSGNPAAELASSFQITNCGAGGFDPKLSAGTANPLAGAFSPFALRLSREDGTQELGGLKATLPPGLVAKLAGVAPCPDAVLAAISGEPGTGAAQLAGPSCPAASRVGTVTVGAGAGPSPFYTSDSHAYLAGPYKGAPLSVAVVAPAVAGPFDLGSVVVRNALRVDPQTAEVTAVSDPLPSILHGVPLALRDVRVLLDRPQFTLNPTSCEEMAVTAELTSTQGASAQRSARFQVGGCEGLGFKPRLSLRLKGGAKRSDHPALTAVLRARPGDANIGRASVALPRSEFLAQNHIRTICTRVQFAARACPKGSVYGRAAATSPILGYPLRGPVYLRSSDNDLPDLVARLQGPDSQPLEIVLVGRIDQLRGGIRTTFAAVPDAPVSKFVLRMPGGRKSLLENSRNICRGAGRATVEMQAHNGKVRSWRPELRVACAKKRGGGGDHRR